MPFLQRNARARPLCARLANATPSLEAVSNLPNHPVGRLPLPDAREEFLQVKLSVPGRAQQLLQRKS
jgi:hypothetical protein